MKTLIIALLLISSTAFAAGMLERDLNGYVVQGSAPNGTLSQLLTVNSTTINMTNYMWWDIYAPSAGCKYRITPTSAKGAYPQFTAPDGVKTGYIVNKKSPFVNFSGCTSAELQKMD